MNWFRVDADIDRHPKVLRLAAILGVDRFKALGYLLVVLSNVARYAEDGDLSPFQSEVLAGWIGGRNGRNVVESLFEAGIIDRTTRHVHGWMKRQKPMLDKRDRDRKRHDEPAPPNARRPAELRNAPSFPSFPSKREDGADAPPADKPPALFEDSGEQREATKKRSPKPKPDDALDPTDYPDLASLWLTHVESTGRTDPRYVLTSRRLASLRKLVEWAGGVEAAEGVIRAVGASVWHRENKRDSLEAKPFRTREAFAEYVTQGEALAEPPHLLRWRLARRIALEVLPFDGRRVTFAGEPWDVRLVNTPPDPQDPLLVHPTRPKSVDPIMELSAAAGDEAGMRAAAARLFEAVA